MAAWATFQSAKRSHLACTVVVIFFFDLHFNDNIKSHFNIKNDIHILRYHIEFPTNGPLMLGTKNFMLTFSFSLSH